MAFPLAAWRAWKAKDRRAEVFLLWLSGAFTFVFFSLSTGKRNVYLLPIYPMLGVVLASVLLECWDGARRRLARVAGACLAVGAAGVGVCLVVAVGRVPGAGVAAIPMTAVCFAAALVVLVGAARAFGWIVVVGIVD